VYRILYLIMLIVVISCGESHDRTSKPHTSNETTNFPSSFAKGLNAHGGLDKWNSYRGLKFSVVHKQDTTRHTIDLGTRDELIEKEGHYKLGFSGDDIHIYPVKDSFPNENPKFYQNLLFYFFGMPFVVADEGANQKVIEDGILDGTSYDRILITFGDSVGIAPEDQYVLWFDKETQMLRLINYSVTYFDASKAQQYSAIVFNQWQEIDGLKMPAEMVGYRWENDQLGDERYRRYFIDVDFDEDAPDPTLFKAK